MTEKLPWNIAQSRENVLLQIHKFKSQFGHITFVEIDHKISTVILHLLPIQEGQPFVTGESVHKYWLTVYRTKPAQEKSRLTDQLDMNLTMLTWP